MKETVDLSFLAKGIPLHYIDLPYPEICLKVPHAPKRPIKLTKEEKKLAIQNALRYFPKETHKVLESEFESELDKYGHIYMYRFRPTEYELKAYPIDKYPAKLVQCKAIQLMIMNNLDAKVAQYPHELITYGGNGSVLSNWAQYHLLMKYLSEMNDNQTLVMYSGHPLGLFPSTPSSTRVVITNGMVIPNYSSKEDYEVMYAQGVSIYGQMTAGSYCYIGPQGIVHGTTITILNAGRKYLKTEDLRGKIFVTSGLGGMSGAQPKAGDITGCVTVVAEVNPAAIEKRLSQGWVSRATDSLDECIKTIKEAKKSKQPLSLAYHGNIVDLWERLADESELLVDLGSDQTSCHNPFHGGYYPVQLSFEESNKMMNENPTKFKDLVQKSLRRHIGAINKLSDKGLKFWDYGNSFLLEASRAGADVGSPEKFKYPSYVEDIMGDIFSLGFGPFRWVCTSGKPEDLSLTDKAAAEICRKLEEIAPENNKLQYKDNLKWIEQAEQNKLVVGSQARILYSNATGRTKIALEMNRMVKEGILSGPVVISRDHHDVSGTDSPYRETANITDGSKYTADMAVQNFAGLVMRGATWAAIHNGGGTGWGEAINGGFGLVLDGTEETAQKISEIEFWDVIHGIARRAWGGNNNALWAVEEATKENQNFKFTLPYQ